MLDRSVIAIPLLEKIKAEDELIEWARKNRPELIGVENCGIIYRPTSDLESAWQKTQELLAEAARKTGLPLAREKIEPPEKGTVNNEELIYSFARLSGRVVRKLRALNSDLKDPPILQIVPSRFEVIIDLNLDYLGGRDGARQWVEENILAAGKGAVTEPDQGVSRTKTDSSKQYVFARLEGQVIKRLVQLDLAHAQEEVAKRKPAAKEKGSGKRGAAADLAVSLDRFRAIHCIWPDFPITACITRSVATVKADAAQNSFSATGEDITWAVMDSGIEARHPHFQLHGNVSRKSPLHRDFTDPSATGAKTQNSALIDRFGHGTHVAGIIAGEQIADRKQANAKKMIAVTRAIEGYEEGGPPRVEAKAVALTAIRGMAPRCELVSLKVLDDDGHGEVSNLIAAIAHIQEKNGHGRHLLIQGVNISLGYEFEPEWFACGQSPLCVEINRLVRSGVVVVVAAGNTGYGALAAQQRTTNAGMEVTINDPGNAELAITVGSTHREKPHVYGVSFFSSKGPTGDGRLKPDLVAPGEKILSAATGQTKEERAEGRACAYVEDSGTSMAAPHVSGVAAAFLSVRREFIGEPERVKEIFIATATDLKRDRYFQGAGLIDLMRAIQSV